MTSSKKTIVTAATTNYADYLYTFLQSASENLKKGEYKIIVIHNGLEDTVTHRASKIAGTHIDLRFYNVATYTKHRDELLSLPTYWRLLGPHITNVNRLLYIDLDTLILEDISELYTWDLKGTLAGACVDYLPQVRDGINNWRTLKLNPGSPYFNAGVLLIDTKKYLRDDVTLKILEIVKNNQDYTKAQGKWPQNDQYGLNVALFDNWLVLPPGYNYGSGLKNPPTHVKIVHFIGEGKPGNKRCKPEFTDMHIGYLKRSKDLSNSMEKSELKFTIQKPFGNLFRKKCVLIAAQDSEGNILIGAKPHFFPPTISRLLGGGVDEGESFEEAAVRELEEELDVKIAADKLTPLALFVTDATDEDGKEYHNETAVFKADIGNQTYKAGDDVKHIITMTPDEVYELGERYEQLPGVLWYNGEEGLYAWSDYAKLYGPIHKITAEKIKESRTRHNHDQ